MEWIQLAQGHALVSTIIHLRTVLTARPFSTSEVIKRASGMCLALTLVRDSSLRFRLPLFTIKSQLTTILEFIYTV